MRAALPQMAAARLAGLAGLAAAAGHAWGLEPVRLVPVGSVAEGAAGTLELELLGVPADTAAGVGAVGQAAPQTELLVLPWFASTTNSGAKHGLRIY